MPIITQREILMYPTAEETAATLALILKRSEQSRARLSGQTIRKVARRSTLRSAFVVELIGYDWLLVELSSGGFGAVQAKALEAAKPVTGKKYLTVDERKSIDRGEADYNAFHREVVGETEEQIDDE
jgi:hypothetical protein